jgi:hypothetical protein
MSRLVVPPGEWAPDEGLKDDTRECLATWRRVHRNAKSQPEPRLVAWQLAMLPTTALRRIAAQDALVIAGKYQPDVMQLREACAKLVPETPGDRFVESGAEPALAPWMRERMAKLEAEADAVLRGAGLEDAGLSGPAQMQAIADHLTPLLERRLARLVATARREALAALAPEERDTRGLAAQDAAERTARLGFWASVRDGTWFEPAQIEQGVAWLVAQGAVARQAVAA